MTIRMSKPIKWSAKTLKLQKAVEKVFRHAYAINVPREELVDDLDEADSLAALTHLNAVQGCC